MKKGVDYPGVAVVYFCHDGNGNVVFSLRGQNCRDEKGRWDIGGGGVDLGDTLESTLRKEVAEEYGVEVLEYELLGYRDVFRKTEEGESHWIAIDFKVRIEAAKVKNGEPHKFDDVRLFHITAFPSPIHSQFPFFFEKYKERLLA